MSRRCYPLLAAFVACGLWMGLDSESQATPLEAVATLTPPVPTAEELTEEQKALLELLQNDGMAALICYAGYVIVTPPNGVNEPPKDNGGNPKDDGGNPTGPPDETPDPPDEPPPPSETPEPGSIVLGLLGLGVASLTYRRRRKTEKTLPA